MQETQQEIGTCAAASTSSWTAQLTSSPELESSAVSSAPIFEYATATESLRPPLLLSLMELARERAGAVSSPFSHLALSLHICAADLANFVRDSNVGGSDLPARPHSSPEHRTSC
jgi:hypothetical protein